LFELRTGSIRIWAAARAAHVGAGNGRLGQNPIVAPVRGAPLTGVTIGYYPTADAHRSGDDTLVVGSVGGAGLVVAELARWARAAHRRASSELWDALIAPFQVETVERFQLPF
jgi:hypothetical protein